MVMKRYHVTSDKFEGYIEYKFNEDSILLILLDMTNATIDDRRHIWILKNIPRDLVELENLVKNTAGLVIKEVPLVVTFSEFWNKYDDKDTSSKIKTHKAWIKMNDKDQAAAFLYIQKYFSKMPYGTRKKYAETYLNAQLWNN